MVTHIHVCVMLWKQVDVMEDKTVKVVFFQGFMYADVKQSTAIKLFISSLQTNQ